MVPSARCLRAALVLVLAPERGPCVRLPSQWRALDCAPRGGYAYAAGTGPTSAYCLTANPAGEPEAVAVTGPPVETLSRFSNCACYYDHKTSVQRGGFSMQTAIAIPFRSRREEQRYGDLSTPVGEMRVRAHCWFGRDGQRHGQVTYVGVLDSMLAAGCAQSGNAHNSTHRTGG